MKRILLSISIILIMSVNIYADVYVLIETETRNVLDLSPRNDAVIQEGQEKIIIPGIISDYPLLGDIQDYKFINNRFVLNTEKVNEKSLEISNYNKRVEELKIIRDKSDLMAKKELEKEGIIFKQVKDEDFNSNGNSE